MSKGANMERSSIYIPMLQCETVAEFLLGSSHAVWQCYRRKRQLESHTVKMAELKKSCYEGRMEAVPWMPAPCFGP